MTESLALLEGLSHAGITSKVFKQRAAFASGTLMAVSSAHACQEKRLTDSSIYALTKYVSLSKPCLNGQVEPTKLVCLV
jgi:hypothetical protein